MWKEAQGQGSGEQPHPTIPGVTVEEHSDLADGAVIIE